MNGCPVRPGAQLALVPVLRVLFCLRLQPVNLGLIQLLRGAHSSPGASTPNARLRSGLRTVLGSLPGWNFAAGGEPR